nr:hypothetical protein [Apibacter muscae]
MPRTGEIEFSLLPTVQTQGLKVCNKEGKTEFLDLGLLPTPTVSEAVGGPQKVNGKRKKRTSGQVYTAKLQDLAYSGLLPTPATRDFKGGRSTETLKKVDRSKKNSLPDFFALTGKTSQLNPLFAMEMMGFPPNHCEPLLEIVLMEYLAKKKKTKLFQKRLVELEKK